MATVNVGPGVVLSPFGYDVRQNGRLIGRIWRRKASAPGRRSDWGFRLASRPETDYSRTRQQAIENLLEWDSDVYPTLPFDVAASA